MIIVEYLPSGEKSPLPNGEQKYVFQTFSEFETWTNSYVCKSCREDYNDMAGRPPETLAELLDSGCGFEIYIEDHQKMIEWESKVK